MTEHLSLQFEPVPDRIEQAAREVVDAAIHVHSALGPGLLESVYRKCLVHALRKRGLDAREEIPVPIHYDGLVVEGGLRLDLLVAGGLVIELKAVDELHSVHRAQLLTYLKLSGCRLGLLFNFNAEHLRDGIQRVIR